MTTETKGALLNEGHKLPWHLDRVAAWHRGERIAPITIDLALTRGCDAGCTFCFAALQNNRGHAISREVIDGFIEDSAKMGVRSLALLSDGESLLSPHFVHFVEMAEEKGLDVCLGSNCHLFTPEKQERALSGLTYLRINFPAGDKDRYCDIMQVGGDFYDETEANIRNMVELKARDNLKVTLGLQMVLQPQDADQILPFTRKAKDLGVDYAVIKHTADDELGSLGVNYSKYPALVPLLEEAQSMAEGNFQVQAMLSKMLNYQRTYERCYGPPFIMQISGTGLVAPCGPKFNQKYAKLHIGSICEQRWYDIWQSERYWEVMDYLASPDFNAKVSCATMCRQDRVNRALDNDLKGVSEIGPTTTQVLHQNFI